MRNQIEIGNTERHCIFLTFRKNQNTMVLIQLAKNIIHSPGGRFSIQRLFQNTYLNITC